MKKMIALLLALVLALSLAACGNNPANTYEPQNTPANALEKIKADGVLSVALSPDFSPMEFV
ncbi:MAG: amino acid ABC transporter substrate-binding protein, partial [Angelakisella sp.]|nr:amino acid ABC transporter substrate-binding protein [Angelakisella sp.]